MEKNTIIEGLGFFLEVLCFFLSGFFYMISITMMILFFIGGLYFAFVVGNIIKANAK